MRVIYSARRVKDARWFRDSYRSKRLSSTRWAPRRLPAPMTSPVPARTFRDEIIDCGRLYGRSSRITFPVTSCSEYDDRRHTTFYHLEQVAWPFRRES